VLTPAEEVRLAKRVERGDARAKDEMVERNLRLVVSAARSFRGRGVPFDDLVQEGTVGLVCAVERFDYRRGLKFSTYAIWWIRRSLVNAVGGARAIHIPPAAGRQLAAVVRAEDELRRLAPGPPPVEAIADRAGLSVRTVRSLRDAPRVAASLDEPVGDEGTPLGELIADPGSPDAWQQADERETRRQLWSMLRLLPRRHREVLLRRYGFVGDRPHSHQEIGASIGVGEERSRQLERQALHWLRELGAEHRRVA
jgi:RNA polymerase primary sigma factor